jgi:pimeloyl-ACP methyl ester carboxylesterase
MIRYLVSFLCFLSFSSYFPHKAVAAVVLPKPTGHYSVGTRALTYINPQKKMLRGNGQRRWVIQAFYPVDNHSYETFPYMPGTLKEGKVKGIQVHAYSQPNAPITSHQKLPVILFIPGFGNGRQNYTILLEELASQGYVVFSIDQPYQTNFVRFPSGESIVITFYDAWKSKQDRDYRYHFYDESMDAIIDDIRFTLDHLKEINHQHFSDRLDDSSISIMGHSFGGNVSNTLGFEDQRIKAIVDIDSKITDRKVHGHLGPPLNTQKKPVLFLRGALQYQEDVGDLLTRIKNAQIVNFEVQHSAFSDIAFLSRKIEGLEKSGTFELLYNWFLKLGPPFDAVDVNLGGRTVEDWFLEYKQIITRWLSARRS